MSHTGSLDKVVLEAMACEVPVLTCNEAFKDIFGDYTKKLLFKKGDYKGLVEKINNINNLESAEHALLVDNLRKIAVNDHDLSRLIKKIVKRL
jgi:glycosyltransferase involved in cell wall biosynthesis